MPARMTLEQRIEKYVTKQAGGCWLWGGAKTKAGYGMCKSGYVHRLSYEKYIGPIPAGMNVLHRCDVRNCCNPAHLYAGTQKDNARDMWERGRANHRPLFGERHPASKLSDEQARRVIGMAKCGLSSGDIARQFSVSTKLVRRIVIGETRKHLQR